MIEYKTPPIDEATGDIVLPPVDFARLNNGDLKLLSSSAGVKFRQIRGFIAWNEDDIWEDDPTAPDGRVCTQPGKGPYDGPVDEADLLWALGKLQLKKSGYEPSDENADLVRFEAAEVEEVADAVDPQPAQ